MMFVRVHLPLNWKSQKCLRLLGSVKHLLPISDYFTELQVSIISVGIELF